VFCKSPHLRELVFCKFSRLQELSRKKLEARERLVSEPEATDPDAIKIMLKLPNGMRLDRCFRKTDSIKV